MVLPVELVSFTGECDQQQFQFQWQTASEIHNDHFSVQRSANGKSWLEVGRVPGAGNSSVPTHYHFTDTQPLPGSSYYRLQQSDKEEGVSYSSVIQLNNCNEEAGMLTISPNPTDGLFSLAYSGSHEQVSATIVYNPLGIPVFQSAGFQSTINLSGSPAGVYYVYIITPAETSIQKLLLR